MAKIMVVDDDRGIRTVIKELLIRENFDVIEAENGPDCLKKLEDGAEPDLILLDVMMPKMDGWEVSKRIKENELLKNIKVCMLTVKNTTVDALTSIESAHADWHLNKPISKKDLLKSVNSLTRTPT